MPLKMRPVSEIVLNLGLNSNGKVQKYFANRCKERMNARYVPEDTGTLINTSYVDTECNIHYSQPYAFYQYYGMRQDGSHVVNPENYTKAGTGTYWDKRMWSAEKQQVIADVQNYIGGKK